MRSAPILPSSGSSRRSDAMVSSNCSCPPLAPPRLRVAAPDSIRALGLWRDNDAVEMIGVPIEFEWSADVKSKVRGRALGAIFQQARVPAQRRLAGWVSDAQVLRNHAIIRKYSVSPTTLR